MQGMFERPVDRVCRFDPAKSEDEISLLDAGEEASDHEISFEFEDPEEREGDSGSEISFDEEDEKMENFSVDNVSTGKIVLEIDDNCTRRKRKTLDPKFIEPDISVFSIDSDSDRDNTVPRRKSPRIKNIKNTRETPTTAGDGTSDCEMIDEDCVMITEQRDQMITEQRDQMITEQRDQMITDDIAEAQVKHATSLLSLPNELLQEILVRVPGRDVAQLSRVCSLFQKFYGEEWVWKDLCRNELGLEVKEGEDARRVYEHVYFHYGAMQGLFHRCLTPGGGLLQISFRNKCLVATDIQIDRFDRDSLSGIPIETEMFSIKLDKLKNLTKISRLKVIEADCMFGGCRHTCAVTVKRVKQRDINENSRRTIQPGFSVECNFKKGEEHSHAQLKKWCAKAGYYHSYGGFSGEERRHELGFSAADLIEKVKCSFKFGFSYVALKQQCLLPPVPEFDLRDTLIKHGVYVGDFMRENGFQIVNLTYESWERLPYLLCRKVTSDEPGPEERKFQSGLTTLRAKMENIKVIDWDWEERPRIQEVREKGHVTYIELDDLKNRPPQAFSLPLGCGVQAEVPSHCRTVFWGEMMINDGDRSWKWEWAEGYLIVFDEDKFGFLNLRSNYLHMFCRMKLNY